MNTFQAIGLFVGLTLFFILQMLFWSIRRGRARREAELYDRLRASEYGALDDDGQRHRNAGWVERIESVRKLGNVLIQAGMTIPVTRFLAITGGVVGFVLLLVTVGTGNLVSALLVNAVLVLVIYLYVNGRRRKRLDAIDEQLPQALELMTFSLRAGHTLEEGINFVAREIPEPLGGELRRCYEEYELGRPLQNALLNLSLRLAPCQALRTFVEAVLVLKQTGGNLVEIIENLVETLRAQAAYEARHRALTAEGRTSGIILGSLPLLILAMVMLVQPGYIGSLLSNAQGRFIMLLALGLWGLGVLWLFRLLRAPA